MAELSSVAVLQVSRECLAVETGEKEGEALLTFPQAVEVYNVHDNRCVRSWPLGSSDRLTCHASFHKAMGGYCAVRNEDELLLWAVEDNTLPSAFLSLPSPPFSILTPSLSHYLITVDSAGSLAMVTVEGEKVRMVSEVNLQGRRLRGKRLSVVKCEMSDVGGRESAVIMCGGGEVFVCAVDTGGLTLVSSLNLGAKLSQLSLCVCGDSLLVTDGGGIISHNLSTSSSRCLTTTSPGHMLTAISDNLFVSANEGGVVFLRDSIFGTCQARVDSGLNHIKMLWSVWDHVVMGGEGEGVKVCRVTSGSSVSLADVLGRKTTPPPEAIAVSSKWVESRTSDCWKSEVGSSEEMKLLSKLCDPQQTPTVESVAKLFPPSLSLSPPTYLPLVRRLARESQFWAHSILTELVKAGAVTGSEAGLVVEKALQQGDWALVVLTINQSEDIPESSLISLLQHALDLPEKLESHGEQFTREGIIWRVLGLPYSDSLLQPSLSHLPLSSVLSLLQFLAPHISVASLCQPPPLPYPRLLDWLAVLLDTHWPALAMSPAAKHILHNFHHTTYHQMLFCENLVTVQNVLEASKRPRRPRQLDKYVTFERLKIKI